MGVMLRLQPSTISLKAAETKEYERFCRLRSRPEPDRERQHSRRTLLHHHGQPASFNRHRWCSQTPGVVSPRRDSTSLKFGCAGLNTASLFDRPASPSDDEPNKSASTADANLRPGSSSSSAGAPDTTPQNQLGWTLAQTEGVIHHSSLHMNMSYQGRPGTSEPRDVGDGATPQTATSRPRFDVTSPTSPVALPGMQMLSPSDEALTHGRSRGSSRRRSLANSIPKALPPPFSTTPRAMQGDQRRSSDGWQPLFGDDISPTEPSPRIGRRRHYSASVRNTKSSAYHFISAVRSLSIHARETDRESTGHSIVPSRQTEGEAGPRGLLRHNDGSLPSSLSVYDDSLPASTQPRTPAHLSESRHRSRIDGTLTTPSDRRPTMGLRHTNPDRRQRPRRRDSPTGLGAPGFEGLYGGRENTDEEGSWWQAATRS